MEELCPGVYHWTAIHPRIGVEVSSYFLADSSSLIDPLLPPEGVGWLRKKGPPERVILTNRHHYRHSGEISDEFGCPVLCHRAGLHEFGDGREVEGFEFGDQLASGVRALEVDAICPEETALHIAAGPGLISFADGLIRHSAEPGFVSDGLIGDDPEAVKRSLRAAFRRMLDLDFDGLLFAHGDPLIGGGRDALRRLAEAEE
jgi:hypothetical protein